MKIFDMFESDWLYKSGCTPVGFGYGKKDGKAYVLFNADEHFRVKLKEWVELRKQLKK